MMSGSRATTELQEDITDSGMQKKYGGDGDIGPFTDVKSEKAVDKIKADKGSLIDKIRSRKDKTKAAIDAE